MTTSGPRPPRLARWLLRLGPLGARRAEVTADLDEVFAERASREGRTRASLRYYGDVLSLWRWNLSGAGLLAAAVQDVTHGLRVFRRNPGAVTVTVLGLSLAIAVSTVIFSLLNVVAFRPTGVADPASAVRVMRAQQGGISTEWMYGEYLALKESSPRTAIEATLRDGARFTTAPAAPSDDNGQTVSMSFVGGSHLRTFGAQPSLGRMLDPADDTPGAPAVLVASHGFWLRTLDADPGIVGRQVWLNGVAATIVGVASRSFTGIADQPPAFWAPFASYHLLYSGSPIVRTSPVGVNVYGRMPAGATLAQAEAELSPVAAAVGNRVPDPATGVRLDSAASRFGRSSDGRMLALVITIVMTVVGLVVLLACVNVANLQLASAIARQREIGVRLALGATRGRIIRQLVTESLALGLMAGAIGLVLTTWLVPAVASMVRLPVTVDMAPDARVYLFLLAVTIAAGIGAGLAPARHGVRGDLVTPLKGDGPRVGASGRPGRLRATLIGVQAAASLILLVLAALLTRATVRATQVDVGFNAQQLVSVVPAFGRERYDEAQSRNYWKAAFERLQAVPHIEAAALAQFLPYGSGQGTRIFTHNGARYRTSLNETDERYFSTLGLRVVSGRIYTAAEIAARARVAVISETLARDFWPGENAVGQTLERFDGSTNTIIVGVVADAITSRLRELTASTLYRPRIATGDGRILIRTVGPPESAVPALRDALRPLDPRVPLDITLIASGLDRELEESRILATMAGALAVLALGLAAVGIYGVTAFVSGQRTREIGLRMAIGASRADVMRLLLADSLRPVAIGLTGGLIGALLASRLFAGVLYGVKAHDPVAFTVAAVVLLAAAAVAVFIPTRWAARVDPAFVLRQS